MAKVVGKLAHIVVVSTFHKNGPSLCSLQALLEGYGVYFTGCGSKASQLCMDKADTGAALRDMEHAGIFSTNKYKVLTSELVEAAGNGTKLNVVIFC